jgi:hypothetical protein
VSIKDVFQERYEFRKSTRYQSLNSAHSMRKSMVDGNSSHMGSNKVSIRMTEKVNLSPFKGEEEDEEFEEDLIPVKKVNLSLTVTTMYRLLNKLKMKSWTITPFTRMENTINLIKMP